MSKIITVKQLRTRLSLLDDSGINEACKSAITAAIVNLEAALDTSFTQGTTEDIFFIDPVMETPYANHYTLKLHNGFVSKNPDVQVYEGFTLAGVRAMTTPAAIGVTNYEKGYILVTQDPMGSENYMAFDRYRKYQNSLGRFVRVVYTYGFSATDIPPSWLQELVISMATKVLASQQVGDAKPEVSNVFKFIDSHMSTLLVQYLRINSIAINPLN